MTIKDDTTAIRSVLERRDHAAALSSSGRASTTMRVENRAPTGAAGPSSAVVYLYGPISSFSWGDAISARQVLQALADLDVDELEVHVHSPGGEVFEGMAIMNAFRNHKARVTMHVDGLAASAASVVVQAGDEIVMGRGSQMMIHDASMLTWGNAAQLHDDGDWLDKQSENIAQIYTDRAGGTAGAWRDLMKAETWYNAAEAVAAGLADRVAGADESTAPGGAPVVPGEDTDGMDPENSWDLSVYAYAGRSQAPTPGAPAAGGSRSHKPPTASAARVTSPAAPASGDTTTQEGADVIFNDAQLTSLRQNLGVADDADGDIIVAALQEALQEQATDERPAAGPTTVPEGMVLMDAGTAASLREDAQAGREARNQQLADHRHHLVDAAVRDGRIPRAKAPGWEKTLAADPSMEDTLANLEKGLVPIDEVGHAGEGPESSDAHNDLYAQFWGSEGSNEKKEG